MRLHHRGAQPEPAGARQRDRPRLRQPRQGAVGRVLQAVRRSSAATLTTRRRLPIPASTPSSSRSRRASISISRCRRSPRASMCSSKSRRFSRSPTTSGSRPRATAPDASCSSVRTITTSRWPSRCAGCSPSGVIGEMVFAPLHDDRPAAQDGRRLAQRRDDGRRRRVFRRGHSLAPHRRQPGAEDRGDRRLSSDAVSRGPGSTRQEHDGGVPLRQRRGRVAVLLARDPVALQRAAAVEAVRTRRRHHVRVQRRVRRGARQGRARAAVSGLPRHPRLSGDVSRLRARDSRRRGSRR